MVVKHRNFIIRLIKIEDLEDSNGGLYETLERLSPSPKTKPEEYQKLIKDFGASSKDSRCLVAVLGKKIVGTITVWINSRIPRGHQRIALIEDLAVRKDFESLGVGQALINDALKFARETNCQRARLICKPELKEFYEKSGFNVDGISMRKDF
jgi:GNAT superfamily N-acetyltransferase